MAFQQPKRNVPIEVPDRLLPRYGTNQANRCYYRSALTSGPETAAPSPEDSLATLNDTSDGRVEAQSATVRIKADYVIV